MAQRQVSILSKASESVAAIAYFIESQGMPTVAKKFVDECFLFFEKLSNPTIKHRVCRNEIWNIQGYRCANFKKNYIVAYLDTENEIIICDFALHKLLK